MNMNRILYIITTLLMVIAIPAEAESLSRKQAQKVAEDFFSKKSIDMPRQARRLAPTTAGNDDLTEPIYIFNAEQGQGFVIVSGDDRTEPILGYSNKGNIDTENMPENLQAWLDGYRQQIKALQNGGNNMVRRKAPRADWPAIGQLMQTEWNQHEPYNRMCPEVDGKRCVTGCVATAFAQVLYYLRCPQGQTMEIPAYQTASLDLPSLPATRFDWDKMLPVYDEYSGNYTEEEGDAVAKLMRYCGQAVEMNYTPKESAAYPNPERLSKYFGISKAARELHRNYYSAEAWEEIVYKELAAQRPVVYSAATTIAPRHALVCDGYDGEGRFHLNWGWGGMADGYFVLSLIMYPEDHTIIVNLKPEDGIVPTVIANYLNGKETSIYKRSSANNDFKAVKLDGYVQRASSQPIQVVEFGWGLYRNNDLLKVVWNSQRISDWTSGNQNTTAQIAFGAGLTDGTYQLRQIFRQQGDSEWTTCLYAYRYYYLATINNNQLTVTPIDSEKGADFTVNSASFEGELIAFREVTLNVNINNTGHTYLNKVYVCIDGVLWSTGGGYCNPGENATVPVTFTLGREGGHKVVTICADANQTKVLYTLEVDVADSPEVHLSGSIKADGMRTLGYTGYVDGNGQLPITLHVRNDGNNTFSDRIYFILWTMEDRYVGKVAGNLLVHLEPGEERELYYILEDLSPGRTYTLDAMYFCQDYQKSVDEIINFYYGKKAEIEVVSVEHGKLKQGRYVPFNVRLRNTGGVMFEDLFYSLNGSEPSRFLGGKFKLGEEREFRFIIIPDETSPLGKQELTLCTDWDGNSVFYSEVVDVGEALPQSISCTTSFVGMVPHKEKNYVAGNRLEAVLHLKNEGTNVYDDDIILHLTQRSENDNIEAEYEDVLLSLSLAPGDSIDLRHAFEEMKPGNYQLESYYYSRNEKCHMSPQSCVLGKSMIITVDKVEYERPVVNGDQIEIMVHARNTGDVPIDYLMMKIGNSYPLYVSQSLRPGEQKVFTFRSTINLPEGDNDLIICTDETGEDVIYRDIIKVKVPKGNERLMGEIHVADILCGLDGKDKQYIGKNSSLLRTLIPETTLNFTCTLTNDNDYTYDDDIRVCLARRTLNSSTPVYESIDPVVIAPGETLTISHTVEDLVPGAWYDLTLQKRSYRLFETFMDDDYHFAIVNLTPALSKAFQVDDVSYSGTFVEDKEIVLHAHVKNNSEIDFDRFDLVYDEDSQWENDRHHTHLVNLPAGGETDIELPIVFKKGGRQSFELTPYVNQCVILRDTIDVEEAKEQSLLIKCDMSLIDETDSTVCMAVLVNITNNGKNDYNNDVEFVVGKYSDNWGFYRDLTTQVAHLDLKQGEQTEFTVKFDGLDANGRYDFVTYYYSLKKEGGYHRRPEVNVKVSPRSSGTAKLDGIDPGLNQVVTLTAQSAQGYVFSHWEENGDTIGIAPVMEYRVMRSANITAVFVEMTYEKGDIGGKGYTDVTDVVATINHILGEQPLEKSDAAVVDMNSDGEVNVSDIILMVKKILEQGNSIDVTQLARGSRQAVDLTKFTAMQLSVDVPEGSYIGSIRLSGDNSDTHQLMYQQAADGSYTVVVWSMDNQNFSPVDGQLIEVTIEGGGEAAARSVLLANKYGERLTLGSLPVGTVTGIGSVNADSVTAADVYDLRGNKVLAKGSPLKRLPKGVYVIIGKKIVK